MKLSKENFIFLVTKDAISKYFTIYTLGATPWSL